MEDMNIRLECLRLAVQQINSASSFPGSAPCSKTEIELATEFYDFIRGNSFSPVQRAA